MEEEDIDGIAKSYEIRGVEEAQDIIRYTLAYERMMVFGLSWKMGKIDPSVPNMLNLIVTTAKMMSKKNMDYRSVQVVGKDGKDAVPPVMIPAAVKQFVENFSRGRLTAKVAHRHLMEILPFPDGNKRVADLVWRLGKMRETGDWPRGQGPSFLVGESDEVSGKAHD